MPGTTITVLFASPPPVSGRVRDISVTGISVEYEDGAGRPDLDRPLTIVITGNGNRKLHIDGIGCQPVYDIAILAHGQSFRGRSMRQFGMAYSSIGPTHRSQLDQLLATLIREEATVLGEKSGEAGKS